MTVAPQEVEDSESIVVGKECLTVMNVGSMLDPGVESHMEVEVSILHLG